MKSTFSLPSKFRSLLFVPLLAVGFFYLFGASFYNSVSFFYGDVVFEDLPAKLFYSQNFHFTPSLWNDFLELGYPVFADPVRATFYPFQSIFALGFDPLRLLPFYILAHLFLGACFMFLCARSFGASRYGSALAGFTYVFCGASLSQIYHTQLYSLVAWLPLAVYLFEKGLKQSSAAWIAASAGSGALLGLSVKPSILLLVWFCLGCLSLRGKTKNLTLKTFKPLWVWSGLVFLLCAVQGLPYLQLLTQTDLSGNANQRWFYTLHPLRLVDLLFPLFFGNIVPSISFYWGRFLHDHALELPYTLSLYMGALPLAILAGLIQDRAARRQHRTLVGMTGAFLLIALFPSTPLTSTWSRILPVPEDALLFFSFGICLLAGLAFELFLRDTKRAFLIVFAGFILTAIVVTLHPSLFEKLTPGIIPAAFFHQARSGSYFAAIHGAAAWAALCLLLSYWHYFRNRHLIFGLLVAFSILDVTTATGNLVLVADSGRGFARPFWFKDIPDLDRGRLYREPNLPIRGPARDFADAITLAHTQLSIITLRPETNQFWGLKISTPKETFPLSRTRNAHETFPLETWLGLSASHWVLGSSDDYSNLQSRYHSISYQFDIFETPYGNSLFSCLRGSGAATQEESRHGTAKAQMTCEAGDIAVFHMAAYPGWEVFADGHWQRPALVQETIMGVPLQNGPQEIAWRFRPASLRWGLLGTLLGLGLFGLLVQSPKRFAWIFS